jgi:uncharacterized protein (DUF779 family)
MGNENGVALIDVVRIGDLKRSTQHFIFERDGGCCDGSKGMTWICDGREDGAVGSLAAGGVSEVDWPGVWKGLVVHYFPVVAAWRDPA